MASKETIIDNILDYTSVQIAAFVRAGDVTVPEILRDNAQEFAASKRREVENMIWDDARSAGSADTLRLYLDNYPSGQYASEAREMLGRLSTMPPADSGNFVIGAENEIPEAPPAIPSDCYESVNKKDPDAIIEFLREFPNHPKARELRQILNELRKNTGKPRGPEWLKAQLAQSSKDPSALFAVIKRAYDDDRISTFELLDLIEEDHNFLPLEVIKSLVDNGILSTFEMEDRGIDKAFLDVVDDTYHELINTPIDTSFMRNPVHNENKGQEIYFWGMPSSGKTCALGAILSAAGTGRVAKAFDKKTNCCGYDYMRQLSDIFRPGKISVLPTGTKANMIADMSFDLLDQDNRLHSITLVDLAGEMLYAMYMMNQGLDYMLEDDQREGYECMKNLLIDKNSPTSKIHFFVIEYDAHDRKEKGIRQVDMVTGALAHIRNLGILKKTDAVYILMTKADKALKKGGNPQEELKNYLMEHYQSFYNTLRLNTSNFNKGEIVLVPFTIGDVCFQDLCRFDDRQANKIVQLFLDCTVGERTGKLGKMINIGRG